MPHFGRKILGDEEYEAAAAIEERTHGLHFGSRVLDGPPEEVLAPPAVSEELTVRELVAAVKSGADLTALARDELGRPDGVRKSVVRTILSAAKERPVDPEAMGQLLAAIGDGDTEPSDD